MAVWFLFVGLNMRLFQGCRVTGLTPPKSSYLIRPSGTFSREKERGIFYFWGGLERLECFRVSGYWKLVTRFKG